MSHVSMKKHGLSWFKSLKFEEKFQRFMHMLFCWDIIPLNMKFLSCVLAFLLAVIARHE